MQRRAGGRVSRRVVDVQVVMRRQSGGVGLLRNGRRRGAAIAGPLSNAASDRLEALGRRGAPWRGLPRALPRDAVSMVIEGTLNRGMPRRKPRRHARRRIRSFRARGPRHTGVPTNWSMPITRNAVVGRRPRRLHTEINPPSNSASALTCPRVIRGSGTVGPFACALCRRLQGSGATSFSISNSNSATLGGATPPDHAAPYALVRQVEPCGRQLPRLGILHLLVFARHANLISIASREHMGGLPALQIRAPSSSTLCLLVTPVAAWTATRFNHIRIGAACHIATRLLSLSAL